MERPCWIVAKLRCYRNPGPPTWPPLRHVGSIFGPPLGKTDFKILPMMPTHHAKHETYRHHGSAGYTEIREHSPNDQPAGCRTELQGISEMGGEAGADQPLCGIQRNWRATTVQSEHLHG